MRAARGQRTKAPREAGFALVELLVAILVISILVVIAVRSTGGTTHVARQKAMQSASEQVFEAAVAFNGDFPRVGRYAAPRDPLLRLVDRNAVRAERQRAGGALPASESAEIDRGFFTRSGQPYFREMPSSPYGGQVVIARQASGCPTTGQAGWVYLCRPAGRPGAVRVTGWGKATDGSPLRVFDQTRG